MKEAGKIIGLNENKATVETIPSAACTKCCSCSASRKRKIQVTIEQQMGLQPGDIVELDIEAGSMLKVYAMMYGLPLIVFIASLLGLYFTTLSPIVSFFGAICITILAYVAISFFFKRYPASIPSVSVTKK